MTPLMLIAIIGGSLSATIVIALLHRLAVAIYRWVTVGQFMPRVKR